MADQEPANEPTTAIEKIHIPEIVDFDVIQNEIAPSIDKIIARAQTTIAKVAAGIKDDETMAIAVREAEALRDNGQDLLKAWREEYYMDAWYRPGEVRREFFDSRLKPIAAYMKTLLAHVSDYKGRKEREAKLARERAEAEARRQLEEAERKMRDAEEAERRAKQAAEDEKKRIREAEEAEVRRVQAERDLRERQERESREAAARETQRKLKEEEDSRMRHAEVAQEVGNGAAKVDTILESATPISPVLGKPEQAKDLEALRLEQEQATRVAEEKLLKEEADKAAAEKRRKDAEAEAFRAREDANAATAAATSAAAAAAAASIPVKTETETTSVERWVWDFESDGSVIGDRKAIIAVLKGVVEALEGKMPLPAGFDPLTFIGYDEKHPEQFRPSAISKRVTEDKDRFRWPGIRAYPQQDERLKRRVVGGRR